MTSLQVFYLTLAITAVAFALFLYPTLRSGKK